jgi:hypothetical protein
MHVCNVFGYFGLFNLTLFSVQLKILTYLNFQPAACDPGCMHHKKQNTSRTENIFHEITPCEKHPFIFQINTVEQILK